LFLYQNAVNFKALPMEENLVVAVRNGARTVTLRKVCFYLIVVGWAKGKLAKLAHNVRRSFCWRPNNIIVVLLCCFGVSRGKWRILVFGMELLL